MPAMLAQSSTFTPARSARQDRTPPHLSLRALRSALDLTLEQVSLRITEHFPEMVVSRGSLSAIESGARGASDLMLRALERAYGLPEDSLTTDYSPRVRGDGEPQ
ncbi:helix-turn-helix domain-containing protein [Litorihabitans aurantiacus]|nr:helix-turn-helix transcriptional regulator [Litorihabitans aurantiacus]